MSQITKYESSTGPGSGTVTSVSGGVNITITGNPTINPTVNVSGTTQYAVQVGFNNGGLFSLPLGNLGQVLTSQGAGANPSWTTIGGGTITSVTTTNATPQFVLAGTVEKIDFGISNLILGSNGAITTGLRNVGYGNGALNAITSGSDNIGIGSLALTQVAMGSDNVGIGTGALSAITSTSGNTAVGFAAGNVLTGTSNAMLGTRAMQAATNAISNVAIGAFSMEAATTAISNTAVGYDSLANITSGSNNIALGASAASAFTSSESSNLIIYNPGVIADISTIRIGDYQFGGGAGKQNKTYIAAAYSNFGTNNTFVGEGAGNSTLTTGSAINNVAVGTINLTTLTTGANNTALGAGAGASLQIGSNNTLIGNLTGSVLTNNGNNTAVGYSALATSVTGVSNTTLGYQGLLNLTSGSNNLAIGTASPGSAYTTESNNLLIYNAGVAADANTIRIGTQGNGASQQNKVFLAGIIGVTVPNPAATVVVDTVTGQLGVGAGGGSPIETLTGDSGGPLGPTGGNFNIIANIATLNAGSSVKFAGASSTLTLDVTDSNNNTMIGNTAGAAGMSGTLNVALGYEAGSSLTSGQYNTFVGATAGAYITSGTGNTAVGELALGKSSGGTSSSYNTAIGYAALYAAQDPGGSHNAYNIGIGYETGFNLTSGIQNVLIGQLTGYQITTGSGNLIIGLGFGGNIVAGSNNIYISSGAVVGDESGKIRIGNPAVTACYISGIDGVNVGSIAKVVTEASNQLGTATITAGTGTSIAATANTITVNTIGGGVTWTVIAANQTAAVNNGYFCNKAGTLALALPAVSAVGDVIEAANINTALGVQFTQAAGQQIFFSTTSTTLGATGTLTSTALGDTIKLVCRAANTTWQAVAGIGNWSPA